MKVLYLSGPSFLDMDLSFVKALNERMECYYLLDLYPKLHRATALNLSDAPQEAEVLPMDRFSGMTHFGAMVPLERCYVINRTENSPLAKSNLLLQWKLYRWIRRLNPDVIHFNNQIYFTHFYLFLMRERVLTSIHDPFPHSGEEQDAERLSSRIYQALNGKLIHYHLLYNRIMVEAYASSRGISTSRVCTSGLGPYEYLSVLKEDLKAEPCDFLIFGRIQRYKGIDLLLEAFAEVILEYPHATLVIAGSGEFWFDPLAYGIPEANLRILNRFIPGPELSALIEASSVVVCPYRDATQSGVVMSAYAFHKPVIVTDVGALSQSVEEGKTGFVVPPHDAKALAEAMKRSLRDDSPLRGAEQEIETIYHRGSKSWGAIADSIREVYQKIEAQAG